MNKAGLIRLVVVLVLGGFGSAQAQQPEIVVRRSAYATGPVPMQEFIGQRPDVELIPRGAGAPRGHLWIRSVYQSLLIVGKVDGRQPDFPRTKAEILSKDHIEVWIAGSKEVGLPELGWGDQFEDTLLPKGQESCAELTKNAVDPFESERECRGWVATQERYRRQLKRIFLRQWLLAPDLETEAYATPAFEKIEKEFSGLGDKIPVELKPQGEPRMFLFPDPSGYWFEISVPFDAFPPWPNLQLGQIYLLVDVFGAAPPGKVNGAYSTSSGSRVYGDAKTFNEARLEVPETFRLTPCELPLMGTDKRGNYHPAWFLPLAVTAEHENAAETFVVVNDPAGYRYGPAGLSPTVRPTNYFWLGAGPGKWVCGPSLTYRAGDDSKSFPYKIAKEGLDVRRLEDGHLLIKTGPRVWYSEFGSGQCGVCPWTDLRIFDLGPDLSLRPALSLGDMIGPPNLLSEDFKVSAGWLKITQYELKGNEDNSAETWSSVAWCLSEKNESQNSRAYVYEKCAEKDNAEPPNPPVLKELRDLPE